MTALRFIPIQLTFCLAFGIALSHYVNIQTWIILLLVLSGLSYLGMHYNQRDRRKYTYEIVVALTVILLGVLSIKLSREKPSPWPQGTHQWHLKIRKVLKSTAYTDQYLADILHINGRSSKGQVLLNLAADSSQQPLLIDQELIAMAEMEAIRPPLNPRQFNYKTYMQELGVYSRLRPAPGSYRITTSYRTTIPGIASSFRKMLTDSLHSSGFKGQELAIIQALLFGDRIDIEEDTYTAYKNAGAIHILAVSGLHVGILLYIFHFLLGFLDRSPRGAVFKLILLVTILWSYALIAGFTPSVLRAVAMFSFVAYALYLNRPSNSFNILALSMFFILLLINPGLLFQVGFQLSYAAVLCILWGYPRICRLWSPKNFILRRAWQLTVVSFTAQLGVLPLSLYYFHQFPGLFFISNLFIIPFLGIILGGGIFITIWAAVGSLPKFLAALYHSIINTQNQLVYWISDQQDFIFSEISFDLPMLIISACLVISFLWCLEKPSLRRILSGCIVLLILQLYSMFILLKTSQRESLWVMHQNGKTQLLHQAGQSMTVYTNDDNPAQSTRAFRIGENIRRQQHRSLENFYEYRGADLVIVGKNTPADQLTPNPRWVLFTNSPGLHLDRFIDYNNPQMIIADGSNYHSYVDRWRKSCQDRGIPFHYTGADGALLLDPGD
ncbi:ComEC/Rec2 family competence protein [Zeaxanthinibacter sp. PT1]|uniref:ComEC/Rec2 family competence protein n=1 Tax=Zeaxanthinibacter TaxID=561554 RepID=UPI00234B28A9|nr:ComEC/Rec2 family competence protein [Zeaxanthinibacter sp. PT1]MDC6351228.1 ComEC/Rec2 family competence protein [Zeaxanthinibacter sp. PT1]